MINRVVHSWHFFSHFSFHFSVILMIHIIIILLTFHLPPLMRMKEKSSEK